MPTTMPQIETVVMLMLENRSLDTMLGWLYEGTQPANVYPPGSDPLFNGIPKDAGNRRRGKTFHPTHGLPVPSQRSRMPRWGPKEDMEHVQIQMYADGDGVIHDPNWGPPPMTGFAWDFPVEMTDHVGDVMGAYTAADLPVLYSLARDFAVSDRWFSSVPSETDPNRAFSVCGTSLGAETDFSMPTFDAPTIFNGLNDDAYGQHNKSWGIYWQYNGVWDLDPRIPERICFTADKFTKVHDALENGQGVVDTYENFLYALRHHQPIPAFCYIEPHWGWGLGDPWDVIGMQGNDYHPPTWVGAGEWDLNELYEAPTPTIRPDHHKGKGKLKFLFERLGPRVPTILVSPFIAPATVFRAPPASPYYDFDHTSFIRTVLLWAGTDPEFIASMGLRVASAPTFDGVLSDRRFPKPPEITVPAHYAEQSRGKGLHGLPFDGRDLTIEDFKAAARVASSREELFAELERRLRS